MEERGGKRFGRRLGQHHCAANREWLLEGETAEIKHEDKRGRKKGKGERGDRRDSVEKVGKQARWRGGGRGG